MYKLLHWHWKGVTFDIGAAIPLFSVPKVDGMEKAGMADGEKRI